MCSGFFFCLYGLPPQSKPAALPAPSGREPLAWRESFRLNRKACLPGSYPFRQSLRLCHLPQGESEPSPSRLAPCHLPRKGEVLLYLPADAKKLPLRGSWHRVAMTERVKPSPWGRWLDAKRQDGRGISRSAALSQKAALHLPFPSTTPPMKRQFWKIRRFSRIAKL